MEEKKYPYLGKFELKSGKKYVVLFLEKDYGVVVTNEIDDPEGIHFGLLDEFDESKFTYLEEDLCVRLQN